MILLFHVVSTFLAKHCKSCHNALAVVSNMQRMPKISPLFPAAKAGQVQIHFADLQTLATMLLSHRNAVHPLTYSMTTFATTLSFKSEKLNPKIMPLLVAGLRNLDNGWLLYEEICSACLLLGQAYILPTSGCNLSHSRKTFQIRWKKNWPEFSNVASKFYMCWSHERAQRKIRKPPVTTMTIF